MQKLRSKIVFFSLSPSLFHRNNEGNTTDRNNATKNFLIFFLVLQRNTKLLFLFPRLRSLLKIWFFDKKKNTTILTTLKAKYEIGIVVGLGVFQRKIG